MVRPPVLTTHTTIRAGPTGCGSMGLPTEYTCRMAMADDIKPTEPRTDSSTTRDGTGCDFINGA